MKLERASLQTYLEQRHKSPVQILALTNLGGDPGDPDALKQFAYGAPVLVEYQVAGTTVREVFHRIRRTPFGRERDDDRIAAIWLDYHTFNRLPHHVPATDMVAHLQDGRLESVATADDLLLITGYRPGHLYADDLMRLRDGNAARPVDYARVEILARYLADIHSRTHEDPALWKRRLRDLIGHGEGIMGLTDSYPVDFALAHAGRLRAIEERANGWRWRLKGYPHRLSQVHGDFHPFNILFGETDGFCALDRSRGEWGEPADDVSCLTINYIFFSLQRFGDLDGPFRELHDRFWSIYLNARPDKELTQVIQPWYAWRALVLASPVWYPTLDVEVRRKILAFCEQVLETGVYDYQNPSQYWREVP